ncbi:MAG: S8 family serine peptidase [Eubacterium sp.]
MRKILSVALSVLFIFSGMPLTVFAKAADSGNFDSELVDLLGEYYEGGYFAEMVIDVNNNTFTVDGGENIDLSDYDIDYSSVESSEYVMPAVPVLDAAGLNASLDEETGEISVAGDSVSGTYSFDESLDENDDIISTENGVQTVETENGVETRNVAYFNEQQAKEFNLESKYDDGKIIITNPYQTKRIVVQTKNSTALKNTYGAIKAINDDSGYYVLQFDSQEDTKAALSKLKNTANVDYAVCDEVVKVNALSDRTGAKTMQSDRYKTYLKNNKKTTAVKVAVLDTGVATNHSFLKSRLLTGYNAYTKKTNVADGNGHGTHVAGIVADNTPSNVKILPVKVMQDDGTGTDLAIKAGIDYAVKQKVNVINMSLGGTCTGPDCPINVAVKAAIKAGVTVVVAAGNDTRNTNEYCPAGITECITVSSADANGSSISNYSNYGSAVDLTAPGENILSCSIDGDYQYLSGTSMAAPFAAAAAAMVIINSPSIKPAKVEETLKSYCADMLLKGWDKYSGAGIINFGIPLGDTNTAQYLGIGVGAINYQYFSKCSPYLTSIWVAESDCVDSSPVVDRSVTASSTNINVAYFDGRYIIPKGTGTCTVTIALPNGEKSSCNVTVVKKEVWIDYAASSYASGSGTKSSPYQIKTAAQLAKFAKDIRNGKTYKGKYFKLMNDIDLKGKLWITASCFTRSSSYLGTNFDESYFMGNFDGGNHKIKNMHVFDEELHSAWGDASPINSSWYYQNTGFIGDVQGATIKNLGIDNAYCVSEDGGLLVDTVQNSTTISNCYTSGFTAGSGITGLFLNFDNRMSNCYSSATVLQSGISSYLYSSMQDGKGVLLNNVFFCGTQLGKEKVGSSSAFIGSIESCKGYDYTKIYNCFSAAKSPENVGFASSQKYSTISKCYYSNLNTKGLAKSTGGSVSLSAKPDSFFKTKSSYTTASNWNKSYKWDFTNTWAISTSVNDGYPYLKKNKPTNSSSMVKTNTWLDYAAKSFAGGSGTKSSPYLISNAAQLARVAYLYRFGGGKDTYFKLTANIDLSAHKWFPIGAGYDMNASYGSDFDVTPQFYSFMGNIDGNGKTITGLTVSSKGVYSAFISKQFNSYVKNLFFKDVNISGGDYTGAVSASASGYAVIFNCSVSGKIIGKNRVGALASIISSTSRIIGSSSNAELSSDNNCGGLVCENEGTIDRCSFSGKYSGSSLFNALAFENRGTIKNSYAALPDAEYDFTSFDSGEIMNSYYCSKNSKLFDNCLHGANVRNVTVEDLENKDTFNKFDFDTVWLITESVNDGCPILRKVDSYSSVSIPSEKWKAAASFAGGKGTKENPYLIANAAQLALLRDKYDNYNNKYFRIIRNINLSGKYWSSGYDGLFSMIKIFIDGNNKTISNVAVKDGDGLFPFALDAGGYIKNLNVKNVTGRATGGLCSANFGTISYCTVTGNFSSANDKYSPILSDIGGICSSNYGTISRCSVNLIVNGDYNVGGITADNCGKIQNCYVRGTMISGDAFAGRCMFYSGGRITNCYSAAKHIKNSGIVISEGGIENIYYLGENSGIDANSNCVRTDDEMKKQSTYTGWNFNTVWQIDASKNNGYPTLIIPESKKITYVLNGGTATSSMENDYIPGIERTLQSPTYKYGVFDGWYKEKSFKTKVTKIGSKDSGNVTFYAKWKPAYCVTFKANGGSGTTKDQTIAVGSSTALRANAFKRTGYTFTGWAKSKNGKVVYKNKESVKNLTSKNKTITLYAKWKANSYSVKFNANGGKGSMKTQTGFKYGTKKALAANSFKAPKGKVFAGWATAKNGSAVYTNKQKVSNLTASNKKTVTLYAKWVTPKTYKITYKLNGGKMPSGYKKNYKSGTGYTLPKPTKKGYTFAGWYTDKACTKGKTTVVKPWITGDKTYYAKWKKK